ncbi:juvenile hormone acid O-methyltransferase-like isoform X2 [Rhipicephalus microplus]|uniref:juvenile hormone acid O-methyltransferase-like isoform X2 n=1 Tax=Rhipicephalus microplus TaxID=6941 RepID=UPI003F6B2EEE
MAHYPEQIAQAESRSSQRNERVKLYDLNCQGHVGIVAGLLDTFHKAFAPSEDENQQFLDIGCGTGRLTAECLLPRCPPCRRLVAVDKSSAMLKFAAKNYPHPKIVYLALDIVQDVEEFKREQGQFQRVYSFLTLHWMLDQRRCLSNIERLMAPGGECFLLFKRSVHFFALFEAMISSQRWSKYSQVLEDMTPATAALNDVASLREITSFIQSHLPAARRKREGRSQEVHKRFCQGFFSRQF